MTNRILLCGAPSSGKTTLINALKELGYSCEEEISREIIQEAQQKGIEQPFLENPKAFNEALLQKRIAQFQRVENSSSKTVFLDRGIIDVIAYMKYGKQVIPAYFDAAIRQYRYDKVFLLPPWDKIHVTDQERYESYEISKEIHLAFIETLSAYNYSATEIPFGTVKERISFLLKEIL